MEQVQDQLSDILDKALTESTQPLTQIQQTVNGKTTKKTSSRWGAEEVNFFLDVFVLPFTAVNLQMFVFFLPCLFCFRSHRMDDGKVFMDRASLLE